MAKLLEVYNLTTHFYTDNGVVEAVDGISYSVDEGEIVGIVGESGCGKSVSALSIMGLIPDPPGKIVAGEVIFDGQDLLKLSSAQMRKIRGNDIGMVFQEPMTSLNPVLTIGRQLTETLELHLNMTASAANQRAAELLSLVGIPDAERRLKDYPHQMSGGMRQRVMIAMAVSCNPKLIIADEPTTALDMTIQAQILELMQGLSTELGTAMILITHNLGVVARYAKRVIVMYAGSIIEEGTAAPNLLRPPTPIHIGPATFGPAAGRSRRGQARTNRGPATQPDRSRRQLQLCSEVSICDGSMSHGDSDVRSRARSYAAAPRGVLAI